MRYIQRVVMIALSCSSILSAAAKPSHPARKQEADEQRCVPTLKEQPLPCKPVKGGYNAFAGFDIKVWDVFADGYYLLWKPVEEGLGLAITATQNSNIANSLGKLVDMNFKYHSGYRVGLGTNLGHDDWEFYSQYTKFSSVDTTSKTLKAVGDNSSGGLLTNWLVAANVFFAGAASSSWKLKLDVLDGELARIYSIGSKLSVRPHAGIEFAWINQVYQAFYRFKTINDGPFTTTRSRSFGGGLRAGVDTDFLFGKGFKLFGDLAFSSLYTRYKVNTVQQSTSGNPPLATNFSVKMGSTKFLRPNMELAMGLGWGFYGFNNRIHVDLLASFEMHALWGQNMMRYFMDQVGSNGTGSTDLYLLGYTFGGRFDF